MEIVVRERARNGTPANGERVSRMAVSAASKDNFALRLGRAMIAMEEGYAQAQALVLEYNSNGLAQGGDNPITGITQGMSPEEIYAGVVLCTTYAAMLDGSAAITQVDRRPQLAEITHGFRAQSSG